MLIVYEHSIITSFTPLNSQLYEVVFCDPHFSDEETKLKEMKQFVQGLMPCVGKSPDLPTAVSDYKDGGQLAFDLTLGVAFSLFLISLKLL